MWMLHYNAHTVHKKFEPWEIWIGYNIELKGLFTWSGVPRFSGVGFFCLHALGHTKQNKLTPLDRGSPLHVNRVLAESVYSVFSLTWPASMQIYWNKRKRLHKKRVQLPQEWFGTQTWPPFHCFGTQIWPPWRHVKTHNSWPASPQ